MGHCRVLTKNSSGDEVAKRDLMIHAGYRGLATLEVAWRGVIPLDNLRDFWWVSCVWPGYNMVLKYPRIVKPPE